MSEVVQPTPHMEVEGLKYFQEAATRSRCYLEYGSGGSTVYAVNVAQIPVVISVESDKVWYEKVKASVTSPICKLYLEYCDIGAVSDGGTPKSKEKVENFWRYMATPWHAAKRYGLVPDTILIDGRFRVASFLFSLVSARSGTVILFDDYSDRPQYSVVEGFCQLAEKHGRMGVFLATKNFSVSEICEKIAEYSILWG